MNVNDVSLMEFFNLLLYELFTARVRMPASQDLYHETFYDLKRMRNPGFPVNSITTLRFDWGERVLRAPDLTDVFHGLMLSGCSSISLSGKDSYLELDPEVADRWRMTLVRNAKPELIQAVTVAKTIFIARLERQCREFR